jgi:hypothetical protein
LLWWTKGDHLPPLLTTSNGNDGFPSGSLGLSGTSIVYGNSSVADQSRSGARLFAGYWLTDERLLGVEVGGFFLQTVQKRFALASPGSPPLYRPFFDVLNNMEFRELVASNLPSQNPPGGITSGGFSSNYRSSLWGTEANLRSCLLCCDNFFIDGLAGFRMVALDDDLQIHESPTLTAGGLSSTNLIEDHFQALNRFYGGQLGVVGEWRLDRWSFNLNTKLGLGVTQQTVRISGSTTAIDPFGNTITLPGGLLALAPNMGNHNRNVFTVVPEVGLNVGYQVTDHIRAFVGYDFLYWSNVARAGQQIDFGVNQRLMAGGPGGGPARPAFAFNATDFWAQGITAGVEFRY